MRNSIQPTCELTGIFPRSEELVAATRDLDRRRVSPDDVRRIVETQRDDLVAFQKAIGCFPLSDGLLTWQDIFRPFSVLSLGIEPSTLTRYADTNTFFKQPIVTGALRLRKIALKQFFAGMHDVGHHKEWKATLPSPVFFARVADDRQYGSVRKLALAFSDLLSEVIAALSSSYSSFQLYDPYAGYAGATRAEVELIQQTVQRIVRATHASISYHVVFSCPPTVVKALLDTDCDAIGIDFFNTDIASVPSFDNEKSLLTGCVDSRTSLIERPEVIAKFVRTAMARIKPKHLALTSNDDLQFVPVDIAKRKLRACRQAISLLS